jgi:hypothetical protein
MSKDKASIVHRSLTKAYLPLPIMVSSLLALTQESTVPGAEALSPPHPARGDRDPYSSMFKAVRQGCDLRRGSCWDREPSLGVDVLPTKHEELMHEHEADREARLRELASKLFFTLKSQGSHFVLYRDVDVSRPVRHEGLTLDEVESILNTWKLRGPHGG